MNKKKERLMHGRMAMLRLLAGTSMVAWCCTPVWAQNAPNVPQVDDNAAQQAIQRSQEDATLKTLKKTKRKRATINTQEAAKQLEAEAPPAPQIAATEENRAKLKQLMQEQPNNLDYYFAYAQISGALGDYAEAAKTYEAMLKLAPDLDRVRLDLGATYLKLGRLEAAQKELKAVLQKNPPEAVQKNITLVLAQIEKGLQEHVWSGSVTVGVNADSNANSASSADKILIFDTPIRLRGEQLEQDDFQLFGSAGLTHSWSPRWAKNEEVGGRWDTSLNLYQAEQVELSDLDLKVLSLETGPEIRWGTQQGLMLNPTLSYSHIILDTSTYLKTIALDLDAEYPLSESWMLSGGVRHEFRDFENAPGVTVYEDRTGSASQMSAGVRYILTKSDIVSAEITHRRERTREEYYDNEQLGASASYVHIFNDLWFSNATVGYKNTVYDDNDPLISRRTRHDKERSAGLTIGRKLTDNITATIGYQYRDTDSNLINYDYDNHRVSTSLSVRY